MEQTALKDFQKEIEEMNEDDARLKIITKRVDSTGNHDRKSRGTKRSSKM